MSQRYREACRRALEDPAGYWGEIAEGIAWTRRWQRVLDDDRAPFYRWFAGGETNTCWNALDRHVDAGRGSQRALIWDSPITGASRVLS